MCHAPVALAGWGLRQGGQLNRASLTHGQGRVDGPVAGLVRLTARVSIATP
jgi:hypothetical protein